MKKIIFILLMVTVSWFATANHQSLTAFNHHPTTETALEMEFAEVLIDGIWTKATAETNATTTLQFNDAGLVGILSTAAAGVPDFAHKYWHLEGFSETVYLILTDLERETNETFLIEKVDLGITLTNVENGKVLNLNPVSVAAANEWRAQQQSLVGEWHSTIHYLSDQQERRVAFNYVLKNDGTFVRSVERSGYRIRSEKGYWQLSPTGYLVLHFAAKEDSHTTKLAKIKYLAFDELVIDAFYTDADLAQEMQDKTKTLFFNKN